MESHDNSIDSIFKDSNNSCKEDWKRIKRGSRCSCAR